MTHPPRDESLIRLMTTTPMRDWIRGRLTGRLDRERLLRESALPGPVGDLITRVVHKTRLWRGEKVDVTRELIAHFRDGIGAGVDPAHLIGDFGDPARAARLIRRAKRRNRPLPWRAMIFTRNGLGVLIVLLLVVYAGLAARYFTGRATITRDYLSEINARTLAIPENQRAWPLYREGIRLLPPPPDSIRGVEGLLGSLPPDDPRRADYSEYLERCAPALERFAQAAARPHLGYIYSATDDLERRSPGGGSPGSAPAGQPAAERPPDQPAMLIHTLLPHLGQFRRAGRLMADDTQLACEQGDATRAMRNLRTLLGLCDHTLESPFVIGQLVGMAMVGLTSEEITRLNDRHPNLLGDAELHELAHRLSAVGGGDLRIRFEGESAMFEDTIQHLYTDDGHGDGRLAGRSAENIRSILVPDWPLTGERTTGGNALGPVVMAATAGRSELSRLYHSLMGRARAYSDQPMWERGDPPVDDLVEKLTESPIGKARYWPLLALVPALDRLQAGADVAAQRRDAALTVLALELYRRRHGAYPGSLSLLAPEFLPALPPDQFDGAPIKYRLIDGAPVLYSVGVDRKDDRARRPERDSAAVSRWVPPARSRRLLEDAGQRPQIDGDWILFPPPAAKIPPLPGSPSPAGSDS